MTTTDPIERVVLTHLQIPFKEPFRISGGEVAIKDAILVEVETASGSGSARARRWPRASAIRPTRPEGCWDDLANTIAPSLLGRSLRRPSRTSPRSPSCVERQPIRRRRRRDGAVGPAGPGPARHDRRAPGRLRAADRHGGRGGPGGRAVSQHRRADQDDRGPSRGRLSPGQDQDPARRRTSSSSAPSACTSATSRSWSTPTGPIPPPTSTSSASSTSMIS